ncbi:MAG: hypothetical protein Q7R76_00710 [Candidatus Woesearchaeota archaeon]|nr:hypothetical protein [Candidatus Woesearchaeota archaeon]
MDRRSFLAVLGSLPLASCLHFVAESPVTILLPKNYEPPNGVSGWWYTRKLRSATMDFLKQNHPPNQPFGVWKQPFYDVKYSLEARLEEITTLAVESCQKNKSIHPVDPALLVAGLYVESLFYEFAVSSALAVGVAQFIAPTARDKPFNLVCAGDLSEHYRSPYQLPELAGKQREYESLSATLRAYKKNGSQREKKEIPAVEEAARRAKEEFKLFFAANISSRDIFNEDDRAFLNDFDQRTIGAHAVPSMARYIADSLKARNGNVLAAWSAYNAGLGSTSATGFLKPYGRLPNGDTATYAQKIVLVAENLNTRIFG